MALPYVLYSSNRTFMELKPQSVAGNNNNNNVLIVPLWNWNVRPPPEAVEGVRSNRTFMELKLGYGHIVVVAVLF